MLFSRSVMSDSLQPHGLQHARLPCPSPSPGVCSNLCSLSRWCHPVISSSFTPFSSCPHCFIALGSFSMNQLTASGGQSIGKFPLKGMFIYIPDVLLVLKQNLASIRPRLQNGALMKAELIPGYFWITSLCPIFWYSRKPMFSQLFLILFLQVYSVTLLPIESNLNIHLIQGLIKVWKHFRCVLLFWCFLHSSVAEFCWGNELCLLRHKLYLCPSTLLHHAISLIQEYFQSF